MPVLLTKRQRAFLIRRYLLPAWNLTRALARGAGEPEPDFDTFRRATVKEACGADRLSHAPRHAFPDIAARCLVICGREDEAFRMLVRAQRPSRVVAEEALLGLLSRRGLGLGYAEAVSERRFGTRALTELSPVQIWELRSLIRDVREPHATTTTPQPDFHPIGEPTFE